MHAIHVQHWRPVWWWCQLSRRREVLTCAHKSCITRQGQLPSHPLWLFLSCCNKAKLKALQAVGKAQMLPCKLSTSIGAAACPVAEAGVSLLGQVPSSIWQRRFPSIVHYSTAMRASSEVYRANGGSMRLEIGDDPLAGQPVVHGATRDAMAVGSFQGSGTMQARRSTAQGVLQGSGGAMAQQDPGFGQVSNGLGVGLRPPMAMHRVRAPEVSRLMQQQALELSTRTSNAEGGRMLSNGLRAGVSPSDQRLPAIISGEVQVQPLHSNAAGLITTNMGGAGALAASVDGTFSSEGGSVVNATSQLRLLHVPTGSSAPTLRYVQSREEAGASMAAAGVTGASLSTGIGVAGGLSTGGATWGPGGAPTGAGMPGVPGVAPAGTGPGMSRFAAPPAAFARRSTDVRPEVEARQGMDAAVRHHSLFSLGQRLLSQVTQRAASTLGASQGQGHDRAGSGPMQQRGTGTPAYTLSRGDESVRTGMVLDGSPLAVGTPFPGASPGGWGSRDLRSRLDGLCGSLLFRCLSCIRLATSGGESMGGSMAHRTSTAFLRLPQSMLPRKATPSAVGTAPTAKCVLLDMGCYQWYRGGAAAAAAAGSMIAQEGGGGGGGDIPELQRIVHLMQVVPASVAPRVLLFPWPLPAVDTWEKISPGFFDAPAASRLAFPMMREIPGAGLVPGLGGDRPHVCVAFTSIEGFKEVSALNLQLSRELLYLHNACVRETLSACSGYECKENEGGFMIAFPDCCQGMEWALTLQLALMEVHWSPELLAMDVGAEVGHSCGALVGLFELSVPLSQAAPSTCTFIIFTCSIHLRVSVSQNPTLVVSNVLANVTGSSYMPCNSLHRCSTHMHWSSGEQP